MLVAGLAVVAALSVAVDSVAQSHDWLVGAPTAPATVTHTNNSDGSATLSLHNGLVCDVDDILSPKIICCVSSLYIMLIQRSHVDTT